MAVLIMNKPYAFPGSELISSVFHVRVSFYELWKYKTKVFQNDPVSDACDADAAIPQ